MSKKSVAKWRAECVTFLAIELGLEPKAELYLNRTTHGMDFLGCRVFPWYVALNRRSRVRYRCQLQSLREALVA